MLATYELRIINQALVSLCTIFDGYLDDTYSVVITAQNKAYESEVAALRTGQGVTDDLRSKEELKAELMDNFSRKSIKKKFSALIRCGVDVANMFTFLGFG